MGCRVDQRPRSNEGRSESEYAQSRPVIFRAPRNLGRGDGWIQAWSELAGTWVVRVGPPRCRASEVCGGSREGRATGRLSYLCRCAIVHRPGVVLVFAFESASCVVRAVRDACVATPRANGTGVNRCRRHMSRKGGSEAQYSGFLAPRSTFQAANRQSAPVKDFRDRRKAVSAVV